MNCPYYNFEILYPTYIPTNPPMVFPMTEAIEKSDAPKRVGIYPPTVEPMITPIMIMVLVGIHKE